MNIFKHLFVNCFVMLHFFKVAVCSQVSIVGGKEVKKLQPWMVSIQLKENHTCGGILIQNQWVLTAATCKAQPIRSVTVLMGTLSLSNIKKGSQRVGIQSYEYPKTFNEITKQDDIMLIKLNKKVKVKPRKIPKKEQDIRTGTGCVVTGWGSTNSVETPSDKLQILGVTVIDRNICNSYYNNEITKDMLCAGSSAPHRGTCWGDTGGPLECNKNIVGVVVGSNYCGNPKRPTIYTFLSNRHIKWINSILKKQFNSTTF